MSLRVIFAYLSLFKRLRRVLMMSLRRVLGMGLRVIFVHLSLFKRLHNFSPRTLLKRITKGET